MSAETYFVVWEGGPFRLCVSESDNKRSGAIYYLRQAVTARGHRPSWTSVQQSSRPVLSEIVEAHGYVPGFSEALGILPESPALASKRYWRHRAENLEAYAVFDKKHLPEVARYRALEAAALLEAGVMK